MERSHPAYRPGRVVLLALSLLLVPLLASLLTDEVWWSPADYVVAGVLLGVPALLYEMMSRRTGDVLYRGALAVAFLALIGLLWGNLAVGFVGSSANEMNLWYSAVGVLGFIGFGLARLRPRGMALVMLAATIALMAISTVVVVTGQGAAAETLGLSVLFATLFVGSADLLGAAAREGGERAERSLELQARLSFLLGLLGVELLVAMIAVEGEPTAVAPAILIAGVVWHLVTRHRMRQRPGRM